MPDALYVRDRVEPDLVHPTELTRGPWSPDAQHGGAPAALLAAQCEAFDDSAAPRICALADVEAGSAERAMFVARLTVELLRPVPLSPLRITCRARRPGRKVQIVSASLFADDVEVARADAVRIRTAALPVHDGARAQAPFPPTPDSGAASQPPWQVANETPAFHNRGVEHRFVRGSFAEPGPATDWIRLAADLIEGEPIPPLARVPAAADFGNGVSWTLSREDGWMFINPDLTVFLVRYPTSEWVGLEAETLPGDEGVGLAESRLWDRDGILGRAVQTLLLDRTS